MGSTKWHALFLFLLLLQARYLPWGVVITPTISATSLLQHRSCMWGAWRSVSRTVIFFSHLASVTTCCTGRVGQMRTARLSVVWGTLRRRWQSTWMLVVSLASP